MKMKKYTLPSGTYTQQPLVIGQAARLLNEMQGVQITSTSPLGLLVALGGKMPRLAACVLLPPDTKPQDVDIDALAITLGAELGLETALEVLTDFLELTPVSSLFESLMGLVAKKQHPAKLTPVMQ